MGHGVRAQTSAAESEEADVERQIRAQLKRLGGGDRDALDDLLPLVFEDLRRMARSQRRRVGSGETMRTTALIHEAYLKLRNSPGIGTTDRHHFLHTAALAMRQILIDHARAQIAARKRHELSAVSNATHPEALYRQAQVVLDIDAALSKLEVQNPRLVRIVNYRYFAGYGEREIADILNLSERTVRRDWFKAKAWLALSLASDEQPGP